MISNWKGSLVIPDHARKIAKGEQEQLFALLYQRYAQHMKAYNALDFDDLILLPTCCCGITPMSEPVGRRGSVTCW